MGVSYGGVHHHSVLGDVMSTILFEDEEWKLLKEDNTNAFSVYANHKHCTGTENDNDGTLNSWYLRDIDTRCILCDGKVPDGIQALVTLYEYGEGTL